MSIISPVPKPTRHVVVIGAGVIGLSVADALLDRGFRVTVLERETEPGQDCSYGNGGLIVPSHFEPLAAPGMVKAGIQMLGSRSSPFGIVNWHRPEVVAFLLRFLLCATRRNVERASPLLRDLHLAGRQAYEDQLESMPDFGYAHRGLLMLCATERGLRSEIELTTHATRLGLKNRILDRSGVAEMLPGVTTASVGGVYFEDDAQVSPPAYMAALRQRVAGKGGDIRYGVNVWDFQAIERKLVAVADVLADEFVIAAGAWSGEIGKQVGLDLPMLGGKGYGFLLQAPPETPAVPLILPEARVAVTPMPGGVRFVGTMELGAWTTDVNPRRYYGMLEGIERGLPKFTPELLACSEPWAGLRPCTPDGLPYIGRTRRLANMSIASGHAMIGMSLGPITGRLIAQEICGDKTAIPLDLMSPDRFA